MDETVKTETVETAPKTVKVKNTKIAEAPTGEPTKVTPEVVKKASQPAGPHKLVVKGHITYAF